MTPTMTNRGSSRIQTGSGLVLFPFAIVRFSVMPLDHLAPLGLTVAEANAIEELSSAEQHLGLMRERVLASIGPALPPDASRRRRLLALRRTVDKLLPVAESALEGDTNVIATLTDYRHAHKQLALISANAGESFLAARRRTLAALEESALEPDFRDSLPMLSLPFSLQLHSRAAAGSPERSTSRSKRYRLSLFRYLARACVKPSPFAKLVAVGACRLRAGGVLDPRSLLTAPSVASVNESVLGWLLEICLAIPELSGCVPVELNQSLQETPQGGYEFLSSRWNVSALQRLAGSAALRDTLQLMQGRPNWRLHRLRRCLAQALCEPDDVAALCERMIEVGLLIPHLLPRRGNDDEQFTALACHLLTSARTAAVPGLDAFAGLVQHLRTCLAGLSFSERLALLTEAEQASRAVTHEVNGSTISTAPNTYNPKEHAVPLRSRQCVSAEQLVFEDRVAPRTLAMDSTPWPMIAEQLDVLAQALLPFSPELLQRARLGATLRRYYKPGERVPLLQAVERFLRDDDDKAILLEVSASYGELRERFCKLIRGLCPAGPAATEVALPYEQLRAIGEGAIALKFGAHHASCSAFLQTVSSTDDSITAVLNNLWPGHGKAFGRFLRRLPRAVLSELRLHNAAPRSHGTVVELLDASQHSANRHPPLSRLELALPGAGLGCRPRRRSTALQIRNCFISYDAQGLSVWNAAADAPLLLSDLGLVGSGGRSKVFRLLCCLGAQDTPQLSVLDDLRFESRGRDQASVVQVPRMTLGSSIVVRRRSWITEAGVLLECLASRSAMQRFRNLTTWRRRNDLPRFVFLLQPPPTGEASSGGPRRQNKPQYLDWESPLLLDVVESLRPKTDLYFTEMLPDGESALVSSNGRHAFELILTWYAKGSEDGGGISSDRSKGERL